MRSRKLWFLGRTIVAFLTGGKSVPGSRAPSTQPPLLPPSSPSVDEPKNPQKINGKSERKPAHHRNHEPVADPYGADPPCNLGRSDEAFPFLFFLRELDGHGVPSETTLNWTWRGRTAQRYCVDVCSEFTAEPGS